MMPPRRSKPPGPITLLRVKGGFVLEPLGWRVHGVIGPLGRRWWERPCGLLCSSHGIVLAPRTMSGFWSAGVSAGLGSVAFIGADSLSTFPNGDLSRAVLIPRDTIAAITLRARALKHEIRLTLTDGTESRFYVFAREATSDYRALLRQTYGPVYHESGFDKWWKLAW